MKKTLLTFGLILMINAISIAQQTCLTAQVITSGVGTVPSITGTQVPTAVCAPGGTGATAANWYKYTATQNIAVTVTTAFAINNGIDNCR